MRSSIAALILAVSSGAVCAEQGQAQFSVAVTVPVRVELDVIEQPAEITLSNDDVARGYKDVSARYRVRHNDRNGYLLRLTPHGDLSQHIEVRGLGTVLRLSDTALDIYRPGDAFQQHFDLEFRVVLDATAYPGTFELPLSLAATPL